MDSKPTKVQELVRYYLSDAPENASPDFLTRGLLVKDARTLAVELNRLYKLREAKAKSGL